MIEKTLDIMTKDGEMETFICHPERNGPHPAVFFLMDAHGIREELKDMARRLGTVGYHVLLPNLYYRAGRDTIYGSEVQQEGSAEHTRMRAVRTKMTIPPVMDDISAMLAFVERQGEVRRGAIGLPWLLHERTLCPRGRRALSRSHRGRGFILRNLARQQGR
jgi:carboxymethylenebutenolidase